MLHQHLTINARGTLIDLSQPLVMGILNVTPDSFFDGGRHNSAAGALEQVDKMLSEGADIIDVGGMSSRPGADVISPKDECARVLPVVEGIVKRHPDVIISIDTIHSVTAEAALVAGARIVNDISGGRYDEKIITVTSAAGAPFVCMHMQGLPSTMQLDPNYDDVAFDVLKYFVQRVEQLRGAGIADVILDPGFGFGKTVGHNYELLHKLEVFRIMEMPILVGVSRKSMICKVLKVSPKDALNGTTALHMIALQKGARILRVHDVREAKEVIQLHQMLNSGE